MDTGIWDDAQAGCIDARDLLIQQYAPLVGYVVGRIRGSVPSWVDGEDLNSYGQLGLMDAIQRFDPHRGIRFTTYAVRRIRGSVLDELRKTDWAPRRLRPDARAVGHATEQLTAALERLPTEPEIAAHLGWELAKVEKVTADANRALLESLDSSTDWHDESENVPHHYAAASESGIGEERMLEVESIGRISKGFDLLEPNERTLLALYYFEQMSFKAIASLLGVTESWVCQVYGRAMHNLRSLTTI